MSDNIYLSALQKAAAGTLAVTEVVEAGMAAGNAGKPELALNLYRTWMKQNPQHPLLHVIHFNCSALESALGDTATAVESLKAALALNPDFMPAYINLGGLIERSGKPEQAVDLWRTGLMRPAVIAGNAVNYATTALRQIARVLSDLQKVEGAEAAVRQCLEVGPVQGDIIEQYLALRLAQCKWPTVVAGERFDRKTLLKGIHPLSMAVYTDDPLLQLATADRYVRQSAFEGVLCEAADRRNAAIDLRSRPLRVGYVSSDLRDHAVGYLMAEFFEVHARSGFETFIYYCGPETTSPITTRIRSAVTRWTNIKPMSDDEAAKAIAADGIDILVDVNGHTRDARTGVFARRPAPIQVNWLGYPGTMGTPYHHYIVADPWIIPEGSEMYYSEKVLRLPCYQPNDRKRVVAAERPTRMDAGLPEDAFVYCCFNGTHKISRPTFDRWMSILVQVPGSVLWLLDASPETKARLAAYAAQRGVTANRLVFAPKMPNPDHLARYALADLFLDTVPYGAHTTASDALWMGVPVLTLSGRSFASRVCGSLVRSAGMPELVVTSVDDYVSKAIVLGRHPGQVQAMRQHLLAGRDSCTLFDMEQLVARLADLYMEMVEDHQIGNLPVPDLANLEAYLEAGLQHDHEGEEMLAVSDYHGAYRARLARLHLARPIPADNRIWDLAAIDQAREVLSRTEPKTADTPRAQTQVPVPGGRAQVVAAE